MRDPVLDVATPVRRAFAHNDYLQPRPLYGALAQGFTAVEADVILVGDELRLAHGRRDLHGARTLAEVYLEPLATLVERRGEIYPRQALMLLIDVKSEAGPTYDALHRQLERHREMFTQHRHDGSLTGPVEVIVSGHTDLARMEAQLVRYASADARIPHLEDALSPAVTMVSAKWTKHFSWLGEGPMEAREQKSLARLVERIHRSGCRARFWGTDPRVWPALLEADVDQIVADDLTGLREFLLRHDP